MTTLKLKELKIHVWSPITTSGLFSKENVNKEVSKKAKIKTRTKAITKEITSISKRSV